MSQRQQRDGESFDAFFATLRKQFNGISDADDRLCAAIVHGCRDAATREQLQRMQRGNALSLANAVALCRMAEVLRAQSASTSADSQQRHQQQQQTNKTNGTMATASTEAIIEQNPFAMQPEHMCGVTGWHPKWLQQFSNTKSFLIVYGLLGTIQSMAFLYFVVTLTTIEKRFKIPSHTTGIIISGNEISQILLSLILSYAGGQRNRPRWIAWGVVFCALSCFILALPHFIYGPGDDALHLTAEYVHRNDGPLNVSGLMATHTSIESSIKTANKLCTGLDEPDNCNEHFSYVPLVLIFMSQFVLGIGTTLYYTLGQSYLDDNTKKTNTPMMLAYAMSLRMFGPVVGFLLGFISLRMYIDPWSTPLINNKDPRWLGAWWFGWILLGVAMLLFSWLIGMFPKELPKMRLRRHQLEAATVAEELEEEAEQQRMFGNGHVRGPSTPATSAIAAAAAAISKSRTSAPPQLRDFPAAVMRLLRNKLLMYNILSGIFYILGSSGTITFLSKYMEVQFNKNASEATIVTGPVTLMGMVSGFLLSGWLIAKYRPGPRKLFFWNVLVGIAYMGGQFTNLFLTCDTQTQLVMPVTTDGISAPWNLTTACNANCACDSVPYSPVCDERTGTTYFSPCHAGCYGWHDGRKVYDRCACSGEGGAQWRHFDEVDDYDGVDDVDNSAEHVGAMFGDLASGEAESPATNRSRRATGDSEPVQSDMLPGACMAGCAMGFYIFTAVSCVTNWLGATGRIGNILLNFRVVSVEDKSMSQGLALMMVSLFALIPGPILYGYIIDNACLLWNSKCDQRGNCQLYDARQFRYYLNLTAMALTAIGVFFDVLVWWYGKDVDLYGEVAQEGQVAEVSQKTKEFRRRHQPITPLMEKK